MTISTTEFEFQGQTNVYHGKVRDVYTISDKYLVMIATDRISAFDVILPKPIPYKGQVLNQIAARFLKATEDIVPNWLLDVPNPNASVGKLCKPFKVEMVIRGYLSGHAWREYKEGKRSICGEKMPEGMKENDKFPQPIITPSTKADEGHDEDISAEELIASGLVSEADYRQLEQITVKLFERGSAIADKQGLILVDTKYEFGKIGDEIILMDEIHTPDSSRYFYKEGYAERQEKGEKQKQLSKEFVREWLISEGFQGKEGQQMPAMNEELVHKISERYIELYEKVTGEKFQKSEDKNSLEMMESSIRQSLQKLR